MAEIYLLVEDKAPHKVLWVPPTNLGKGHPVLLPLPGVAICLGNPGHVLIWGACMPIRGDFYNFKQIPRYVGVFKKCVCARRLVVG